MQIKSVSLSFAFKNSPQVMLYALFQRPTVSIGSTEVDQCWVPVGSVTAGFLKPLSVRTPKRLSK